MAIENPLGVGLNLSPYYFATTFSGHDLIYDPSHPHAMFFQIMAETGFLGLLFFVYFLYAVFRPQFISKQHNVYKVSFAVSALTYVVVAQMYPIFLNHQEILSFLFLYLGFVHNKIAYD